MPGYRRKYRRHYNRRYKKKATGSTLRDALTIAKSAWNTGKFLSRLVNSEYKCRFVVGAHNPTAIGNTSINVLPLSVGTAQEQRTGNSVKPLHFSGQFMIQLNSATTHTLVRIIIFRGNNESNALKTQADIFESTSGTGALISHKYDEKRFQTKFLYDKVVTLSSASGTIKHLDVELKLDKHVNYDDTHASPTIPTNGGLYYLAIADGYSSTNTPTIWYNFRTSFTDN